MTEAKKRLTDIDFSREGCHVSLVSKKVGGAANGKAALVFKSLSSAEDSMKEETPMTEMVEKSAVEVMIQKAVEDAISPLQEVIKAKEAELTAIKAAAEEKQNAVRKQALEDAVGTEQAAALFEVFKALDDDKFELVVKSYAGAVEKEAESDSFKEKGFSAEADVVEKSALQKQIDQKYYPVK